MKQNILLTRLLLVIILFAAANSTAVAQGEILLYSSDITDWGAINQTGAGSDDVFNATDGGAGFVLGSRPTVDPTGSTCSDTGFLRNNADSNIKLQFPPFNFVAGGIIELWLCNVTGSNSRYITIPNADAVMMMEVPVPALGRYDRTGVGTGNSVSTAMSVGTATADRILDPTKTGQFYLGNSWIMSDGTAFFKVRYRLPATVTGMQTITLGEEDWHKDIAICAIKIYSSVGTTPYVAATNYVNLADNPKAGGHVMQGSVGGAANSGVPGNDLVNLKGWNITGDVVLTLEGTDAGKFSFTDNGTAVNTITIPNVSALASINVPINFTPSVREGVANAALVITNPDNPAQVYKVALTGITGNGTTTPAILAKMDKIPFYTSVIADVTRPFTLAGVNLTGPVTVSFEGTVANRFKASETSISAINATAGRTIDLTFNGTIAQSVNENMFMILRSPGAADVRIPILAITREVRPTIGEISFSVTPPGTAFLDLSLAGPVYEAGTQVTVKVTPETGYAIARWSDNAGSQNPNRTFQVQVGTRNIVVTMNEIGDILPPPDTSGFVAFTPPAATITADGFRASWTEHPEVSPATQYTVTVYDQNGNIAGGCTAPAGTTFCNISGLTPGNGNPAAEKDFFFTYKVDASNTVPVDPTNPKPTITNTVGPVRLSGTIPFTCGEP